MKRYRHNDRVMQLNYIDSFSIWTFLNKHQRKSQFAKLKKSTIPLTSNINA